MIVSPIFITLLTTVMVIAHPIENNEQLGLRFENQLSARGNSKVSTARSGPSTSTQPTSQDRKSEEGKSDEGKSEEKKSEEKKSQPPSRQSSVDSQHEPELPQERLPKLPQSKEQQQLMVFQSAVK
jgi:hypothetical protein